VEDLEERETLVQITFLIGIISLQFAYLDLFLHLIWGIMLVDELDYSALTDRSTEMCMKLDLGEALDEASQLLHFTRRLGHLKRRIGIRRIVKCL